MVRFVLVETSHPGNIGAVARALKTMAQAQWVLVAPKHFPHPEASALASGATDWLTQVRVVATLAEAVADCQWVLGTSTRTRSAYHWPVYGAREAALDLRSRAQAGQSVALVFGPERTGLSNAHLDHCHGLVSINANPAYPSLNLAQAVQILAYELYVAEAQPSQNQAPTRPLASEHELRQLEEHVLRLSAKLGFNDHSGHLLNRWRRLVHRAQLELAEVNIVRGILASLERPFSPQTCQAEAAQTETDPPNHISLPGASGQ
jgi:tRNA (cytidine32/uridine32-2'-O)-methyltransferase